MATKHSAIFEDGFSLHRTSRDRSYTHAWRAMWIVGTHDPEYAGSAGQARHTHGFAGSEALAIAAARSALADSRYGKHPGDPASKRYEIVETVRR